MRWRPDPEHTASWSAVGGVMVLVGAAAAPYVPTTLALYGCVAFALIGFYVMLGPLLPLPPWRRSLGMNGLLAREWRRAKRRRLWRRVFHRPPPEPDRIPADGFVPDASTVSDRAENFGEKITAETMQIIGAETPPPPRIVQQDRQAEVRRWLAHGEALATRIRAAQYHYSQFPIPSLTAMTLADLTAEVEVWVTETGGGVQMPRPPTGDPTQADFSRLKVHVERQIRDVGTREHVDG